MLNIYQLERRGKKGKKGQSAIAAVQGADTSTIVWLLLPLVSHSSGPQQHNIIYPSFYVFHFSFSFFLSFFYLCVSQSPIASAELE
jgi:cellulose synthase/poly-beta-1,6-N-acetylglucosamine synthase-like glycosyltransferase